MNSFYKYPKWIQWFVAIFLVIVAIVFLIFVIELTQKNPIFFIVYLFWIPICQFCVTPIFTLTGVYRYYSPMLLGYLANKNTIDLHSGTSFDYLFVLRQSIPGNKTQKMILKYHLEGLLKIIKEIEENRIPENISIVGTSYFFNERTIKKLGFELKKPSLFYRFNLILNFIDLFWMYSFSKGKWQFPSLHIARKASIMGHQLILQQPKLQHLYNNL